MQKEEAAGLGRDTCHHYKEVLILDPHTYQLRLKSEHVPSSPRVFRSHTDFSKAVSNWKALFKQKSEHQ